MCICISDIFISMSLSLQLSHTFYYYLFAELLKPTWISDTELFFRKIKHCLKTGKKNNNN